LEIAVGEKHREGEDMEKGQLLWGAAVVQKSRCSQEWRRKPPGKGQERLLVMAKKENGGKQKSFIKQSTGCKKSATQTGFRGEGAGGGWKITGFTEPEGNENLWFRSDSNQGGAEGGGFQEPNWRSKLTAQRLEGGKIKKSRHAVARPKGRGWRSWRRVLKARGLNKKTQSGKGLWAWKPWRLKKRRRGHPNTEKGK